MERDRPFPRHLDFAPSKIARLVENLPVQVGELDSLVIKQAESADPGGGQVEGNRRTERAQPDDQDGRLPQPALAGLPDLGQDALAMMPLGIHRTDRAPTKAS